MMVQTDVSNDPSAHVIHASRRLLFQSPVHVPKYTCSREPYVDAKEEKARKGIVCRDYVINRQMHEVGSAF